MTETTEIENLPVIAERMPDRRAQSGIAALAELSEVEFQRRLEALERGQARVQKIHATLMVPGTDFGLIPGVQKPCLLKPGAERLAIFYGFAASFEPKVSYSSEPGRPPISVLTTCSLHLGDTTGPVVATGCGAANSYERRYRWRRGERICPQCGKEGSLLRSKNSQDYFCWLKKGGCGANFALNDERITSQVVGDVENEDPYDLENTILKIAEKRAFVCAVLRGTGTSSLYGQDTEDLAPHLLPPAQDTRQSPQNAATGPPAAGVAHQPNPRAKAALRAAEKPIEVRAPQQPEMSESDPFSDTHEEIVLCCEIDCGRILDLDEIKAAKKYEEAFKGESFCREHGREMIAIWKAGRLDSELDEKLAQEEKP